MEKITFIFNDMEGYHDEVGFPLPDRDFTTVMQLGIAAADYFAYDDKHSAELARDLGELLTNLVEYGWVNHFLNTDILVGYKVEEEGAKEPASCAAEKAATYLIPGRSGSMRLSYGFRVVYGEGKMEDITVGFRVELGNDGTVHSPLVESVSYCPEGVDLRDLINAWARVHLGLEQGEDACRGLPESIK